MDEFTRVLSTAELGPGSLAEVKAHGRTIALANIGQQYFALDGECPHDGTNLARDGELQGDRLVCPADELAFDVRTGSPANGTSRGDATPLRRYAIRIRENEILVGPPISE